jgi:hypothetical protein
MTMCDHKIIKLLEVVINFGGSLILTWFYLHMYESRIESMVEKGIFISAG